MSIRSGAITIAIVVTGVCLQFTVAAQDRDPPRDVSGTVMDLAEWREIKPREVVVNIVDLEHVRATRAQERARDNRGIQQRVWFNGVDGYIWIEHFPVARFNEHVTRRLQDPSYSEKLVANFYRKRDLRYDLQESRRIHSPYGRSGWVRQARRRQTGDTCDFASVGFLSDASKQPAGAETYDTILYFRDCSGEGSLDDLAAWFEDVKIVPPEYNRQR